MTQTTFWAVLAGVLVAIELGTGTFYLLMLAIGAGAGFIAAYLGTTLEVQMAVAACIGIGAVMLMRQFHHKKSGDSKAEQLDVGNTVHVAHWHSDGTAKVTYRGAPWSVEALYSNPEPGQHTIVAVDGTRLKLKRVEQHS
jgi:membrane protein implicated in regulation of membrane protease activity